VVAGALTSPRVRVVVLNYNGRDLTDRCLDSIEPLDWPRDRLEVVVVDNASTDGSRERLERRAGIRLVRNAENRGFAGGCNSGMRDLSPAVAYVALVNNDATLDPGWLRATSSALEANGSLGAVNGKVLFEPRFAPVIIESPTFFPGKGDGRNLGVRVSGVEVDGVDRWSEAQLVQGFWGAENGPAPERYFQWTSARAELRLPVPVGSAPPTSCRLRLAAETTKTVTVAGRSVEVGPEPTWHDIKPPTEWRDVVNSAGAILLESGHGADRGFEEWDGPQWSEPAHPFAWTGSAVLLRRSYLDDVGLFDERLFLYYEDLDLSWRGRLRGWRYGYVPDAVARHRHSATIDARSSRTLYFLERNRLVVLTKLAPRPLLAAALADAGAVTARASGRELVASVRASGRPAFNVLQQRSRFLAGWARLVPHALRERHRLRVPAVQSLPLERR
jgi:GT2 family glycosyltransferase